MASPEEKARLARLQQGAAQPEIIQKFPAFPEAMRKRFPELKQMEDDIEKWRVKANITIRGGQG